MGFSPTSRTQSTLSEINVTPLVDVVLVLLIIFMVTAPILQTGIEVNLPQTRAVRPVDPEAQAVVTISQGERIYYRSSPVNFNELGERLRSDVADTGKPIFLRADGDVKWQSIVSVIDEIRVSGYEVINLVTKPAGPVSER